MPFFWGVPLLWFSFALGSHSNLGVMWKEDPYPIMNPAKVHAFKLKHVIIEQSSHFLEPISSVENLVDLVEGVVDRAT